MATKLQVWKQALIHLGQATIVTLTDDVEAVNVFGNAWDGVVEEAFNEGDWNAFKKSVALVASATGDVAPGWTYVWDYPTDYMRTIAVSQIGDFRHPFREFLDEGGFLHTNTTPIYLRYISDDKIDNVEDWPTMFWRYVAMKLAYETCDRITNGATTQDRLQARLQKALRQAKSVDARNENNKVIYPGSWIRSRTSGAGIGSDNSGGTLVGGQISFEEGDV